MSSLDEIEGGQKVNERETDESLSWGHPCKIFSRILKFYQNIFQCKTLTDKTP